VTAEAVLVVETAEVAVEQAVESAEVAAAEVVVNSESFRW